MNKLYLLLFFAACSINIQAQYQKLDMPSAANTNHNRSTTFAPQSLNFNSNPQFNDGLKAVSTDKNQAILIKGTPLTQRRSNNSILDVAKDYLYSAAPIMGIANSDEEMVLIKEDIDKLGMHHIKYQQVYKGIPVYGAEVILHGTSNHIDMLMGRYEPTIEVETKPTLSLSAARQTIADHIGEITLPQNDIYNLFDIDPISTELVIYKGKLAYHSTTYSNLVDRREVFIDAHTGDIINEYKSFCKFHNHSSESATHSCTHANETTPTKSNSISDAPFGDETASAIDLLGINRTIHTYEQGGTYYMMDISKPDMFNSASSLPNEPEGVIWTINAFNSSPEGDNFEYDHFTSFNNTWAGSPEAISSQFNGNLAYQYFLDRHARVSINGQAGNIVSFVNVADKFGDSMDNAFWNGFAMFYGNGSDAFKPLARGLDVAGHEMTHGVVQNTANLEYYGESGALNESFADVFGAMIDRDDWLVGEDVVKTSAFPSGALRSLIDPNQGQPTNSFGTGWQPKHVNQQFTGQEDNNGVHINSGIPNHAFYRFANTVGKDKAEDVYYRALDKYLTKSSQFIDARLAVIQSAQDLGLSSNEIQAARDAFDAVGITDGNSTTTPTDIDVNTGEDIIVFATEDLESLTFIRPDGTVIADNVAAGVGIRSKITVTDNGSAIIFVNRDQQVHLVLPDWSTSTPTFQHGVLNLPDGQGQFPNENIISVAVSRQGNRVAVTRTPRTNVIEVADYTTDQWYSYDLYNPTFSDGGENTYDVAYADAFEFDYSSNFIMYDALNQIQGLSGLIEYYDIGFLNIWNEEANQPSLGSISKLFSGLPADVSIGNPTFSKNSEYIIAFDYAENVGTNGNTAFDNFRIYGANIETGDNNVITSNNEFGYPSYSTQDNAVVFTKLFDGNNPDSDLYDVAGFNLDGSKIQSTGDEVIVAIEGRFATWFNNGDRDLVEVIETPEGKTVEMSIAPNPAAMIATLSFSGDFQGDAFYNITDITGKLISSHNTYIHKGEQEIALPISHLSSGLYNVTLWVGSQSATTRLVKQ